MQPDKRIEKGEDEIARGMRGIGIEDELVDATIVALDGAVDSIIAELSEGDENDDEEAENQDEEEEDVVGTRIDDSIEQIVSALEELGVDKEIVNVACAALEGIVESVTAEYGDADGSDDDSDEDEDDDSDEDEDDE